MKIFSFAALLAISIAFLSCSGAEEDNRMCKIAAKSYEEAPDHIKELDGYKGLDPSCKSEEKKLVIFIDLHDRTNDIDWDYVYSHLIGYVPGSGMVAEMGAANSSGVYYNVNGKDMTVDEYDAYKEEYWRKYYEELERNTRDLDIPCVIDSNIALLTDIEIAELKERYGELAIEDYMEAVPSIPPVDGGNASGGGEDEVPPRCGG